MPLKQLEITVISGKSSFQGQLETPGDVTILGSFTGSIKSGTLEISKDGKAVGSVEAENVTIAGYFEGEIVCFGLLTIGNTAMVRGRVAYVTLAVEPGSMLEVEIFQVEFTDTKLIPFHHQKAHSEKWDNRSSKKNPG